MNLNYIIIPLLTMNIFFTAYIAQKFLYIDNKNITINEEHYGECEEQKSITLDEYQENKVKSKTARLWQLRAEIKSVTSPNINLSVLESYNYDRHRVYEEYVKPRVEELKKLDAELNPTKAPSKSIEGQRPPRAPRPPRPARPPRAPRPPR